MNTFKIKPLILLQLLIGGLFLYSGISKIIDPQWSAQGLLSDAKTFSSFFEWMAAPANIGWVNFLNKYGQALIGLGLITGTFSTLASYAGILLMVLYYFPSLDFPYAGKTGFLIDQHIIYVGVFFALIANRVSHHYGIDRLLSQKFKLKGWWF